MVGAGKRAVAAADKEKGCEKGGEKKWFEEFVHGRVLGRDGGERVN